MGELLDNKHCKEKLQGNYKAPTLTPRIASTSLDGLEGWYSFGLSAAMHAVQSNYERLQDTHHCHLREEVAAD